MSLTKGNIVKGNATEQHAIVLAVTKDGKRARLYVYGPDADVWKPVTDFTVETAGLEQCYKCLGSGLFYMGGAVVNGKYTGKTGECYACQGKGMQDDADRLRCHYYWHRGGEDQADKPLDPAPQQPIPDSPKAEPKPKPVIRSKAKRSHSGGAIPAVPKREHEKREPHPFLIDCGGCGCVHRSDVTCPW